ncbi:hypothetical protein Vadar_009730 [Vaccinium darrowii]|uniref:Uncharacterized protein n=1 Tax=Vaccinium darrowii TaxID=229202 RepID=A0ACB7Y5Y7_9ERIC|nr:hypothetical protein Vadar_009730 [Vaccinium darrowii]
MAADPPWSPGVPYLDVDSLDDDTIAFFEECHMLDEIDGIPSLNLADFPSLTQPDFSLTQSGVGANDQVLIDPVGSGALNSTFSVPQVGPYEMCGETSHGRQGILEPLNSTASVLQVGPSEFRGETNHGQQGIPEPDNSGFANPVPLLIWPAPPPVPNTCRCCLILREITHVKGNHMARLEVHGIIGLIWHAVLENRFYYQEWITESQYNQMIDLSKKSMEGVKEYLVQYCEGRKREGYRMQQDPFVTFYEALSVGLVKEDHDNLDTDDFLQLSSENSGENQVNQPEPVNQMRASRDEVRRRSLAKQLILLYAFVFGVAQRERTAKMKLEDLTGYFHLPIEEAAREIKVCPTVIKKICRRSDVKRWPHRKVKSIQKKISSLREILNRSTNAEERAKAQNELESLQEELASFVAAAVSKD